MTLFHSISKLFSVLQIKLDPFHFSRVHHMYGCSVLWGHVCTYMCRAADGVTKNYRPSHTHVTRWSWVTNVGNLWNFYLFPLFSALFWIVTPTNSREGRKLNAITLSQRSKSVKVFTFTFTALLEICGSKSFQICTHNRFKLNLWVREERRTSFIASFHLIQLSGRIIRVSTFQVIQSHLRKKKLLAPCQPAKVVTNPLSSYY